MRELKIQSGAVKQLLKEVLGCGVFQVNSMGHNKKTYAFIGFLVILFFPKTQSPSQVLLTLIRF